MKIMNSSSVKRHSNKVGLILVILVCVILAVIVAFVNAGGASGETGTPIKNNNNNDDDDNDDSSSNGWRAGLGNSMFDSDSPLQSGHGFSDLLYDDDELTDQRQEANQQFIDMFGSENLPGTSAYWTDLVCSSKIPHMGNGYAFVEYNDQIAVVAHVEGEKQPYTSYNETNATSGEVSSKQMYLYKFSIQVSNYDNQNQTLKFNVYIDSTKFYNDTIQLADGDSYSKIGTNMETQVSENNYNKICIKFIGEALTVRDGSDYEEIWELCNKIVETSGAATSYSPADYSSDSGDSDSTSGTTQTANSI